jgi:hypothetical protein
MVATIQEPGLFAGMILNPVTGGHRQAAYLSEAYYTQFISVAEQGVLPAASGTEMYFGAAPRLSRRMAKPGAGMAAVIETDYYRALLRAQEAHDPRLAATSRRQLEQTPVSRFCESLRASGSALLDSRDSVMLGVTESALQQVQTPTLVLHHGNEGDKLHTIAGGRAVARALPREYSRARFALTAGDSTQAGMEAGIAWKLASRQRWHSSRG